METCKRFHEPGFYAKIPALPATERVKRPKTQVIGEYAVERVIAKRLKAGKTEYYVKWLGYPSEENTWEPSRHIPTALLQRFRYPDIQEALIDQGREQLRLVLEQGTKSAMLTDVTISIGHDVVRALFPRFGNEALSRSFVSVSKDDFEKAGLGSCLRKTVSRSRVERQIKFPVLLKPLLARAPSFFNEDGKELPTRRLEKLRISFLKTTRALWSSSRSEKPNGSFRSHQVIKRKYPIYPSKVVTKVRSILTFLHTII